MTSEFVVSSPNWHWVLHQQWLLWTTHLIQRSLNYMEVFSIHYTWGLKWGFLSSAPCTKPFNVHIYGMGCTASYFSLQKCQCWGWKGIKLRNWSLLEISFPEWAEMNLCRNIEESTLAIFSDVACDLESLQVARIPLRNFRAAWVWWSRYFSKIRLLSGIINIVPTIIKAF